MKNAADTNATTDDLPSFLDPGSEVEGNADETTLTDGADESGFEDLGDDETATGPEPAAAADAPPAGKLLRHARSEVQPRSGKRPGDGAVTLTLACLTWVSCALLGTMLADSNAANAMARFGLTPPTLVVLGAVLFVGGLLKRHLATLHDRVTTDDDGDGEWARAAHEHLEFLVAAQHASNERPPAAGEELQHVLMAMQRQEEKINNLTKAIKMYGKPLMEISGQTTELAGALAQAKTAIEAGAEAARQAFSRLEGQLRDSTSGKALAEVLDGLHVVAADVDKLASQKGGQSLEPVRQHLGKIEVAIAALSQRLESSEVQKSLLRLEDATQKTRDEVHQLRGDGLGKATNQLQDRLDKATKGLTDGLQQLRDGNIGGLENGVREIQRELSGVATAVAQIQAIVRSGKAGMAAAPAAPTPAPAPAPAATPTPAAAPAATKGDDQAGGYQTGTRSSSGKNVLGAIAKLKQMKT